MGAAISIHLYRHFNAAGELLYVGISLSALGRLGQHRTNARWYSTVAAVTIETFPTRAEAAEAEHKAIREERPRHNTAHRVREPEPAEKRPPEPTHELQTVRIPEAAALISCGSSMMEKLIASGEVESVKLGAMRLVKLASLRRLVGE